MAVTVSRAKPGVQLAFLGSTAGDRGGDTAAKEPANMEGRMQVAGLIKTVCYSQLELAAKWVITDSSLVLP